MNCFNIIRDKTGICVPFRRLKNLNEVKEYYTKLGYKILKKPKQESVIVIQLNRYELHVGVFVESDKYFYHYRWGKLEITLFDVFLRTNKKFILIGR